MKVKNCIFNGTKKLRDFGYAISDNQKLVAVQIQMYV